MKDAGRVFTVDEIKERLEGLFQEKNIRKAILFGSYAKGLATEKSDVDLVVDSGLLGMKFVGFIEDIRERLDDKEVDLFDITHIIPFSRIDMEISKTGITIYERRQAIGKI